MEKKIEKIERGIRNRAEYKVKKRKKRKKKRTHAWIFQFSVSRARGNFTRVLKLRAVADAEICSLHTGGGFLSVQGKRIAQMEHRGRRMPQGKLKLLR